MSRLGQNFLTSRTIAQKMVAAAEVAPKDTVLEIGPGKGILTEELLKTGAKVIAVEKDVRLFDFLKNKLETFVISGRLILINGDIRDFLSGKPPFHAKRLKIENPEDTKIVSNIPYYLTGRILRLLLTQTKFGHKLMVLMLQKEVATRIADSQPPHQKLNILSISVRVFAEPKIAFFVSKGNFRPRPKVDSAVLILKRRKKDFFLEHKITQKKFFELIRTGFGHPRKLLKNNINLSKTEFLTECGVAGNARAENLSLENWACLARKIK